MRIEPFVLLVTLVGCGPLPVDPPSDAGLPPIARDAGGMVDAGCLAPGLRTAEIRSRCGEPCWTNAKDLQPATVWLYECEGPGGTCVFLDGGTAVKVSPGCTP